MSISASQAQLVRHSAWTLLQQLLGAILALGTTILMARTLGPASQGLYGVVATTAMLTGLCCNLGTPAATTYAVSRHQVTPYQALVFSAGITFVLGGLGGLAIVIAAHKFGALLWPNVPNVDLYIGAAVVPALLAMQLVGGILQGAQAFSHYNTMALVAPLVTCVATAASLSFGCDVRAALTSVVFGQSCAVLWGIVTICRSAACASPPGARKLTWRASQTYGRRLLDFGLMAALANALAYSSYRIDILLLGNWMPRDTIGYYGVAASVAERLWMLSGAINMVLFAQVARRHALPPSTDALSDNPTPMLVRHVLWVVAAAAVLLYGLAPWILPAVFGKSYSFAVAPLRALLPGVVVFNAARILSQDLAGRGLVRINVIVGAACLVVNVVLNILWIPSYGMVGSAWASSVSYGIDTLLKLFIYTRLTQTPWRALLFLQHDDWERIKIWQR